MTSLLREKIEPMIRDVEQSLEHQAYHAAFALALSLPDICSTVEYPEWKYKSRKKYTLWIQKYFNELHDYGEALNSGDIYSLRCAFLHNGTNNIEEQRARKLIHQFRFGYSNNGNIAHRNYSNYDGVLTLQVDAKEFCHELLDAVKSFLSLNENNEVINNEAKQILSLENIDNGFYI